MLAFLLVASGCRRTEATRPSLVELRAGDPHAEAQLLSGFYAVENNSWRWTKSQFSVLLPASKRLELRFTAPEPVLARRKEITLSASVEGTPLAPQTYTQAGPQVYAREIPPAAVHGQVVKVDFQVDGFLAAGEIEARELGVVVSSAKAVD